jgi:hypothetical protein
MSGCLSRRSGLGALAAAFAILLSSCGGASTSPASTLPPMPSARVGPQTMFTPASELIVAPGPVLDELQRLGVDTIHVYLHWADIAPDITSFTKPAFDATNPTAYSAAKWAIFDRIVRDTRVRGMGVMLDLVPPPPNWAEGHGAPHPTRSPEWRPSASEFQQFVQAVGARYSGHYVPQGASTPLPRVHLWSIWNEPNLGIDLAPEVRNHTQIEVAPMLYRGIVNAAWDGLHATGHGGDTILIGEIAPAGATFRGAPGLFGNMPPLRFLRVLYCVDSSYRPLRGLAAQQRGCPTTSAGTKAFTAQNPGLFHASGFADHPYPQGLPPNEVTPNEPDYAELAEIPKLERVLDTLQQVYGSDTRFPIWSTEYGYQTTPPDWEAGTVTPQQAALYLNWSEYITWLNPRIVSYDQYLMFDPPQGNFATGLRFYNGRPKPGYAAFRMPIFLPVTSTGHGHALEVWGCVRPAHNAAIQTHRQQQVQIQFQSTSGAAFKTVSAVTITNRYGYFDVRQTFSGSGSVRLAWSYPNREEVYSRTVAITVQ